jgi:hypothetical protein
MKRNPTFPPSTKDRRPKIPNTIRGTLFPLLAVLVPILGAQASIFYERFRFERDQAFPTSPREKGKGVTLALR